MNRCVGLAATAGSAFALVACATLAPPSGLVIANVTVVSPERAQPLEHAYVRIVDGRIAELSTRRLRGASQIDGTNRYLIPGLIDSHVHLAVPPGFPSAMTAQQAAAHPGIVAAALEQDPKSYLFFGFTTVVDLVGSAERTAQWNARELRPDAYFCGAAAIINGEIRFALFPYFSYGLPEEKRIPPVVEPAKHTPEAVVARIAADGAVCVKTIYDRGMTPTVEEGRALVAAAHARGMPVFIHANRKQGQGFAVAIGVDAIVHGMWRDPNEDAALDVEAREILAAIVRGNIGYQPTTQVIVGLLDMTSPDYLARPQLADAYPAALIDLFASTEGAAGAPSRLRNADVDMQARIRGTIGRATEVTRILAEADAHLLFGSDTPSDMIYTNPPGLNGRLEMDNWIAAGVSTTKLFHALTIDNARMLRLDDQVGTVEPGKTANLLLLRANPLRSVEAYDTIETVFQRGRPIPRAELSARKVPATSVKTEQAAVPTLRSQGVYRLPYDDGTTLKVFDDFTSHRPQGRIDFFAVEGQRPHRVVAAAAGRVMAIQDTFGEQQSGRAAAECRNNYVWIEHANGEWTNYSHLARGSVSELAKLKVGDFVAAGAFIGHEAAVGCAMLDHVHFEVAVPDRRTPIDSGGFLLDNDRGKRDRSPQFCHVPGGAVVKDATYRAAAC